MTTTTEAPAPRRQAGSGPTKLQNIRVDDDLWVKAGAACERLSKPGAKVDRSTVMRAALERIVAQETDPLWAELSTLAEERGTTAEEIQRTAVEQYLTSIRRKRDARARRSDSTT